MRTHCFKLCVSKKNQSLKNKINTAEIIYSNYTALHKRCYRLFHKSLNKFALQKHLTKLKRQERFSYRNLIFSHFIQDIIERAARAYKLFFENFKRKIKIAGNYYKFFESSALRCGEYVKKLKRTVSKNDND